MQPTSQPHMSRFADLKHCFRVAARIKAQPHLHVYGAKYKHQPGEAVQPQIVEHPWQPIRHSQGVVQARVPVVQRLENPGLQAVPRNASCQGIHRTCKVIVYAVPGA